MTFTSITFICFLPIVFALYWSLRRHRSQNKFLILASYLFYGWWDYRFCGLILASSLIDFVIGLCLSKTERHRARRLLMYCSVVCNLGLLALFKYFHFFAESFAAMANRIGWQVDDVTLNIVLPVGISFYTFQTLSYTIDIYRKKLVATNNLVDYLAFVSFFPQLVAGPIERASRLLPQLSQRREFNQGEAQAGCRLILWGFFKKVVIADSLALIVNQVYADPANSPGPLLAFATVCFAFQIYCDFSAYSDIAIGTAKLFGIQLMRNFAYPYFSQNLAEFWRRWHISLSTWFRDYVYIPLGGNRTSRARRSRNLVVTFLVSGFWHGAGWQFLAWGGIHGGVVAVEGNAKKKRSVTPPTNLEPNANSHHQSAETELKNSKNNASTVPGGEKNLPRIGTIAKMAFTFFIVCLCWVFFRAESLSEALLIIERMFTGSFSGAAWQNLTSFISEDRQVRRAAAFMIGLLLFEWIQRRKDCPLEMKNRSLPFRWAVYTLVLWGTLYYMVPSSGQQFIYFEF